MSPRQRLILSHLRGAGYVQVKELARTLDVDVSTIRRDLQALGRAGTIERLHGGVRLLPGTDPALGPQTDGAPFEAAAITAIAAAARRLFSPGDTIALGGGPISTALARRLADAEDLTVVTTDLGIGTALAHNEGLTVLVAGGELRDAPARMVVSGPHAVSFLAAHRAQWCLIEVEGVHPHSGFTTASPWMVEVHRQMLTIAERRCVLVPSSAFGQAHVGFVSETEAVHLVLTDERLPDETLPPFGGRVSRVSLDSPAGFRAPSRS